MKIITAQEAASMITDGAYLLSSAEGMSAWPEEIAVAIGQRFLKEGHPRSITSIHGAGAGNFGDRGEGAYAHEGLLERSISSYINSTPVSKMVADNKVKAWFYPLGTIIQLYREISRGMPGILTKVGLGTFMDARYGGGALNQLTEDSGEKLVEYIPDFQGEEYLYFKGWNIDFSIIRVPVADTRGNLSVEGDIADTETLAVCAAAKACGGTVIVQADKIVEAGSINPRLVKVPAMYVDYVVQTADLSNAAQNMHRNIGSNFNASFAGLEKAELSQDKPPMPLTVQKVMARRAASELKLGNAVNLGIGMPQTLGDILQEEGCSDAMTMLSETGVIGGVPAVGLDFGSHWNPEAYADHIDQFNFYDGGGLKFAVFGMSEIDRFGCMNSSHLNGKINGIGGFTDIATNSKKAIFMGTFTAGGIQTELVDGKVVIKQEGRIKKFINKCHKVSFDAREAVKNHNEILFVTDRCVIRYDDRGFVIEEIAPGIDLQKDILDQMEFEPVIPEGGPRLMDPELFREKWGKLKSIIE